MLYVCFKNAIINLNSEGTQNKPFLCCKNFACVLFVSIFCSKSEIHQG